MTSKRSIDANVPTNHSSPFNVISDGARPGFIPVQVKDSIASKSAATETRSQLEIHFTNGNVLLYSKELSDFALNELVSKLGEKA